MNNFFVLLHYFVVQFFFFLVTVSVFFLLIELFEESNLSVELLNDPILLFDLILESINLLSIEVLKFIT